MLLRTSRVEGHLRVIFTVEIDWQQTTIRQKALPAPLNFGSRQFEQFYFCCYLAMVLLGEFDYAVTSHYSCLDMDQSSCPKDEMKNARIPSIEKFSGNFVGNCGKIENQRSFGIWFLKIWPENCHVIGQI